MALNRYRFYLGPLGAIRMLPAFPKSTAVTVGGPPVTSPVATAAMLGVPHQSLSGRQTFDRFAVKRQWTLQWGYLHEPDLLSIESCYRIYQASSAIYLLDPRRKNCMSYQVSSGGSEGQSTAGFTASAGTLAYSPSLTIHPDLTGYLPGGVTWVAAASGQTLLATITPTIAGSYYTFSTYAYGSGTATLVAQPYDASGNALTQVLGPSITLTGTPIRYSLPAYWPGSTAVSTAFGWRASGAATVNTYGWQCELDQPLSSFSFGVGFPQVIIPTSPVQYPRYSTTDGSRIAVGLTILEV